AILATGDELVAPEESPQAGQIRNSNEVMLHTQIQQADALPRPLGIARDERDHLR
ncbi:MAG TPA: molybdopterin molybdenumtransferase, partial [Planctomycetaceae bacterium]|nr:molybdopterin molybdenumtransferase [Planctomycetaceae bacterium]